MAFLGKKVEAIFNRLLLLNNPYYFHGIAKKDFEKRGNSLYLRKLNIEVDGAIEEIVTKGYPFALQIVEKASAKIRTSGGLIYLEIDGLVFCINSAEEFLIAYEIFLLQTYRYRCQADSILVDVGMNAGFASLFYAREPWIKKVYAYELFSPTYKLALNNFRLNGEIGQKVKAFNLGLSTSSFATTLDYSPSRKGRMGLKGLPHDETFADARQERVFIEDIKFEFDRILAESADLNIIVKMDCEGEEYSLIRRLSETGLLNSINVLMIEWHYVPPVQIENFLEQAGFHVFVQTFESFDSGMIYAGK